MKLTENSDPQAGQCWLEDEYGTRVVLVNVDALGPVEAVTLAQTLAQLHNDFTDQDDDGDGGDNDVGPDATCPKCGERDADSLIWEDDQHVRCMKCSTLYEPDTGGDCADDSASTHHVIGFAVTRNGITCNGDGTK